MNVRSIVCNREIFYVNAEDSVRHVAKYMSDRRVGAVPVLSGDRLAGVLSERDIMSRVVAKGLSPEKTCAGDVMTKELLVAAPDESYEDALRKMRQAGCRHLPVVEGDRLIGTISQRDLMQVDLSAKDEEIRWLNAYIHFIPPSQDGGA
jgi:CBS domain-containing protein